MSGLELPRSEGAKNYVEAVEVNFKPRDGNYAYWDGEKQVETKTLSGVVVYTAMQFMGDKVISKSRSVSYISDPFTWDDTKDGRKIKIKCRTREEGKTRFDLVGEFAYSQIKSPEFAAQYKVAKFRMFNVVYVFNPDTRDLKKVLFSPVVGRIVGKAIEKDQPNFVTQFGVSNDVAIRDENGDFYAPTIQKAGAAPLDKITVIGDKIMEIHRIIAKGEAASPASAPAPEQVKQEAEGKAASDFPFDS